MDNGASGVSRSVGGVGSATGDLWEFPNQDVGGGEGRVINTVYSRAVDDLLDFSGLDKPLRASCAATAGVFEQDGLGVVDLLNSDYGTSDLYTMTYGQEVDELRKLRAEVTELRATVYATSDGIAKLDAQNKIYRVEARNEQLMQELEAARREIKSIREDKPSANNRLGSSATERHRKTGFEVYADIVVEQSRKLEERIADLSRIVTDSGRSLAEKERLLAEMRRQLEGTDAENMALRARLTEAEKGLMERARDLGKHYIDESKKAVTLQVDRVSKHKIGSEGRGVSVLDIAKIIGGIVVFAFLFKKVK